MTKHPKNLAVLNAVADKIAGASRYRRPSSRLSHMMAFGSYVAGAADISVEGDKIKIHKLIGATDPGYAVNPAQIDRQVAGSFVYGISALFYGECTVKDGAIVETTSTPTTRSASPRCRRWNRSSCRAAAAARGAASASRPSWLPPAAIMNAYFRATGKRIRSFPLKNHNLQIA